VGGTLSPFTESTPPFAEKPFPPRANQGIFALYINQGGIVGTYSSYYWRRRVLWGGMLIAFGTLALLHQMDVVRIQSIGHYWPVIPVFAGINNILEYPNPRYVFRGLWLIFLGAWLFASIEQIWGLTFNNSWPFLLIAWGTGLILATFLKSRYPAYKAYCHGH